MTKVGSTDDKSLSEYNKERISVGGEGEKPEVRLSRLQSFHRAVGWCVRGKPRSPDYGHYDDRLAFFVEGLVSLDFETEIPDHGQIIFGTSARGGEIIPDDQTIGSRQESKGL